CDWFSFLLFFWRFLRHHLDDTGFGDAQTSSEDHFVFLFFHRFHNADDTARIDDLVVFLEGGGHRLTLLFLTLHGGDQDQIEENRNQYKWKETNPTGLPRRLFGGLFCKNQKPTVEHGVLSSPKNRCRC